MTETISKIVREKLRWIHKNEEQLVTAWVAETGLLPSESVLCRQEGADCVMRVWVEKKPKHEPKP